MTRDQRDHGEGTPRQTDAKDEGRLDRRLGENGWETRPRTCEESMARFTRALTEFSVVLQASSNRRLMQYES